MPNLNGFLIILCGLPSSGKSKIARAIQNKLNQAIPGKEVIVIDIDQIRTELYHGQFTPEYENTVRKIAIQRTKENLEKKAVVIVDDINYYNSMRHEFKEIADDMKTPYFILYISTPLEKCLEWNKTREEILEDQVIFNIAKKFDIPGQKYLWDTPFDNIDVSTDQVESKLEILIQAIQEKLKNTVESFNLKDDSEIESGKTEVDILTRLFVNFYANLKNSPKNENSLEFRQHNSKKTTFYQNLIQEISKTVIFEQILEQYNDHIGKLNTKRRIYLENIQIDDFKLSDGVSKKCVMQVLVDFMKFLLD